MNVVLKYNNLLDISDLNKNFRWKLNRIVQNLVRTGGNQSPSPQS